MWNKCPDTCKAILKCLDIIMGRIDPVECVGVSQQRSILIFMEVKTPVKL